ncbi:MAG: hypothetical protein WAM81_04930 [Acidimicrobiia bacterium]
MDIDAILGQCESALEEKGQVDIGALGFWKAVGALKRDQQLVARYGSRVAAIDEDAFSRWAGVRLPIVVGIGGMLLLTVAGLVAVSIAYYVDAPWNGIWVLVGTGLLLASTHTLAHYIVGRTVGIRFTHWFIGPNPQPGVKIDYATYLSTPPRARAWMHASGALATKLVPFLNIGAAWGSHSPAWTTWVLLLLGAVMVTTDVFLSTKQSDWKKFRREMRYTS